MVNGTNKVVYSNPGNTEVFSAVHGLHTFAGQAFTALESSLLEASLWFVEENNDSVKLDVLSDNIYSGRILATKLLPPGSTGKRTVIFSDPVYLQKGEQYYIRVTSGAPGTTKGSVAQGCDSSDAKGYKNTLRVSFNLALELVFTPWEGELPEKDDPMEVEPEYTEKINYVLSQSTDILGEALINSAEGPTYENIKDYLKPLMHCGTFLTDSGIYYIPFGRPKNPSGGGPVALHVADGSQIISSYYNKDKITFFVGKNGKERFGSTLRRLEPPTLEQGYLPILKTSYSDVTGITYFQESFSDYIPETEVLVSFIRLKARNNKPEAVKAKIRLNISDEGLDSSKAGMLRKNGLPYVFFSGEANYSSPDLVYELILNAESEAVIIVAKLLEPSSCMSFLPDERKYLSARSDLVDYWNKRLSEGAFFNVPEKYVMQALKNLLIQNLYMGWRYSVGNAYETFYNPESSDMAATIGMYGYLDEQKASLNELIDMLKPGRSYPNWEWGEKLSHAAQYFFMTQDGSLIIENKAKYVNMINNIRDQLRDNPEGLLQKQRFSGDIDDPSYYLHHQAVVWRGLHDMAKVWDALGEKELCTICRDCAIKLKAALISAIEKSDVALKDGTLFIPSELSNKETRVFDPITATKHGSYWNLCICYALASGLLEPGSERLKKAYEYIRLHGGWLLGMVRFNYYPVEIGSFVQDGLAGYKTPGVDNVYGLAHVQLMSDMDDADRLVLAFYSKLAHGMTRDTYISGEGDTIGVCPGEYYRSVYLPPSGANNSLLLKILRLMLIKETTDCDCNAENLCLTYSTPRAWLEDGKTIEVKSAPTLFGLLDYKITSYLKKAYVDVKLNVPSRKQIIKLSLRLRTPGRSTMTSVTVNGRVHDVFDAGNETVDLTGFTGELNIRVCY